MNRHFDLLQSRMRFSTPLRRVIWACGFVLFMSSGLFSQEKSGGMLESLFRGMNRGIRQGADELRAEKTAKDLVDQVIYLDAENERDFQLAAQLLNDHKWDEGLTILLRLVEVEHDQFLFGEGRQFSSLWRKIDDLISNLPDEGRRIYLLKTSGIAERQLNEALAEQDVEQLRAISRRYFGTPAGQKALQSLTQIAFELGEFQAAAEGWKRLAAFAPESEKKAFIGLQARALARGGSGAQAEALAASLKNPRLLIEVKQLSAGAQTDSSGPLPRSLSGIGQSQLLKTGVQSTDPMKWPLETSWSSHLLNSYRLQSFIHQSKRQSEDDGQQALETIQMLVMNDRIALRTLGGLEVRDRESGKVLWESRARNSIEDLYRKISQRANLGSSESDSQTLLFHSQAYQIPELLFSNEIYGDISSNGTLLFAIESNRTEDLLIKPEIDYWNESSVKSEPATNRLIAYDLATGRIVWKCGGRDLETEYSLRMSGTFFFGTPTVSGEVLYLTGESAGVLSLYCLEAATGETLWTQPLTVPRYPLEYGSARTFWKCQPLVADGVILCPTSCGWMIGVDQLTHSLRWAQRYSSKVERFHGHYEEYLSRSGALELASFEENWNFPVQVLSQGKLICTAPEIRNSAAHNLVEDTSCLCIDIQTGSIDWSTGRAVTGDELSRNSLYLAGVWNDYAVFVTPKMVFARSLSQEGMIVWRVPLPEAVIGRGQIVNSQFYVPLSGNQVSVVDLKEADLVETISLPIDVQSSGNLQFDQGQFFLVGYHQVTAFMREGQQAITQDPLEIVRKTLIRAQSYLDANKFDEALTLLAAIDQATAKAADQEQQLLDSLFLGLEGKLRTTSERSENLVLQLHQLAIRSNQLPRYQRSLADSLLRQGDWSGCQAILLDLLETADLSQMIRDGNRKVRFDAWIGGRLYELSLNLNTPEQLAQFRAELENRVAKIDPRGRTLETWAKVMLPTELGQQLLLKSTHESFAQGEFTGGFLKLQTLVGFEDPMMVATALQLMAQQYEVLNQERVALQYWQQLKNSGGLKLADGRAAEEIAQEAINRVQLKIAGQKQPEIWTRQWESRRAAYSRDQEGILSVQHSASSLARKISFNLENELGELRILDSNSGRLIRTIRLPDVSSRNVVFIRCLDAVFLVETNSVLMAYDWQTFERLWTWNQLNTANENRFDSRFNLVYLESRDSQPIKDLEQKDIFKPSPYQFSQYLMSTPLPKALDPFTGDLLWEYESAGQVDLLGPYVKSWHNRTILVMQDGRIKIHDQKNWDASGPIKTLKEENSDKITVVPFSLKSEHSWEAVVDSNFRKYMAKPLAGRWIVFYSEGTRQLEMLDVVTGIRKELVTFPPEVDMDQVRFEFETDGERIYVFESDVDSQNIHYSVETNATNGGVRVFTIEGEPVWSHARFVSPHHSQSDLDRASKVTYRYIPKTIVDSPVIFLISREEEEVELGETTETLFRIRVVGFDKKTGEQVIELDRYNELGGPTDFLIDAEYRVLKLFMVDEVFVFENH